MFFSVALGDSPSSTSSVVMSMVSQDFSGSCVAQPPTCSHLHRFPFCIVFQANWNIFWRVPLNFWGILCFFLSLFHFVLFCQFFIFNFHHFDGGAFLVHAVCFLIIICGPSCSKFAKWAHPQRAIYGCAFSFPSFSHHFDFSCNSSFLFFLLFLSFSIFCCFFSIPIFFIHPIPSGICFLHTVVIL